MLSKKSHPFSILSPFLTAIFIVLLFVTKVNSGPQLITSKGDEGVTTNSTEYASIYGSGATAGNTSWNASENKVFQVMPTAGRFRNLRVAASGAPGSGGDAASDSYTFALMKDGSNTSLTCSITNAEFSCQDLTNEISFTAGQKISLRKVPATTPASVEVRWSIEFIPDNRNETIILGSTAADLDNANDAIQPLAGMGISTTATSRQGTLFSTAGTIKNLYVAVESSQTAANGWIFSLSTCTGISATGPTCTITGGTTTCNNTADYTPTANGVCLMSNTQGGALTAKAAGWGVVFEPTNPNEFTLHTTDAGTLNSGTGTANYIQLLSGDQALSTATAANSYNLGSGPYVIKGMSVKLMATPSAGTRLFTLFQDGVATPLTCSVASGGATTCTATKNVRLKNLSNYQIVAQSSGGAVGTVRFWIGLTGAMGRKYTID